MNIELRGLYLITRPCVDFQVLHGAVRQALLGGVRLVQYRDKGKDQARRKQEAEALLPLCRATGAALLINDDVALAKAVAADGVHLGRDDAELASARLALGSSAIIGVTCHADLQRAQQAADSGADYVSFGAFYPSPTKPTAARAPIALLREAGSQLKVPVCAIGGITPDNAVELINAGADMIAVVSGIFGAPDFGAAACRYAALFD